MKQIKLVTVTREDLSSGYQLVQSLHSLAEFTEGHPEEFDFWKKNSNYMVSLSIGNEERLRRLYLKLKTKGAKVVPFYEPDIGNELTAICFYGTEEMRKHTKKLNLALKK